MIPSPGRVVEYTLSEQNANSINKRREDARAHGQEHFDNATGVVVHTGNAASAGDTYPLIITRVWANPYGAAEDTCVNGQVLLDGNDTLWVTSVQQGDGEQHWREYARVETAK